MQRRFWELSEPWAVPPPTFACFGATTRVFLHLNTGAQLRRAPHPVSPFLGGPCMPEYWCRPLFLRVQCLLSGVLKTCDREPERRRDALDVSLSAGATGKVTPAAAQTCVHTHTRAPCTQTHGPLRTVLWATRYVPPFRRAGRWPCSVLRCPEHCLHGHQDPREGTKPKWQEPRMLSGSHRLVQAESETPETCVGTRTL